MSAFLTDMALSVGVGIAVGVPILAAHRLWLAARRRRDARAFERFLRGPGVEDAMGDQPFLPPDHDRR